MHRNIRSTAVLLMMETIWMSHAADVTSLPTVIGIEENPLYRWEAPFRLNGKNKGQCKDKRRRLA